ncbi:MAG: hypothetical protein ACREJC_21935 [Tepidisphaeraceae bacterium]
MNSLVRSRYLRARGTSLVEVLIAGAITAMLLGAVAAATYASSAAIEMNDQFFRSSQAARVAVNRIVTEARGCQSGVVDSTTITLTNSVGQKMTYSLDAQTHCLNLTLESLPTPETHTLARNVSSVSFTTNGASISVTLVVSVGTNQVTLCGSAMPRRNIQYN